jgi:hypothetical protein
MMPGYDDAQWQLLTEFVYIHVSTSIAARMAKTRVLPPGMRSAIAASILLHADEYSQLFGPAAAHAELWRIR